MSGRFVKPSTMLEGPSVVAFRRLEDQRGFSRLLGGRRLYEVLMCDDTTRLVSFRELDRLLDARRFPADFWACVDVADTARERLGNDEKPQMTSWPSGKPQA